MPNFDETKFVLHGLDIDNRVVRASVFIQKLRDLVQALQAADKIVNGRASFDYMLSRLETGSASVTVREKRKRATAPIGSGIALLETTADAIYNGDRSPDLLPPELLRRVQKLGQGVAKKFSHAELGFSDNNVIRIDDFLLRQANLAIETVSAGGVPQQRYYRGLAYGSFDGVLKEIDARGTMLRGKLVLNAGSIEIDCVMNKDHVPEARESFDKRVFVDGVAHYDGAQQLPIRVDVSALRSRKDDADLGRWRGAFKPETSFDEEDGW
jgi:hypothetical protein